jgi:hypothetical protein
VSETILDQLAKRLAEALAYNANAHVAPAALLWPDEARQWQAVIDRISDRIALVRLGQFDPAARQGPAYWIRCAIARTIDVGLADGPPVVYLPGVGRSDLRAVDGCSAELAPVAELQYRSQWFSHPNGRDWSVRSLLTHRESGLALRVADDADTAAAMLLALNRLLDVAFDRASSQVLDADYFRDLVNPDPVRSLLGWLDDPHGFRPRLDEAQWAAFLQQCKADYGFDPAADGPIIAARKLGERQGAWAQAWRRFAEMPERYPGIPDLLRQARPLELFSEHVDAWPQDNEAAEDQLRNLLVDFGVLTAEGARGEAVALDAEHAWRRGTVWADLGLAPLAFALEQLAALAEVTAQPLEATDLASLTSDYVQRGWRADDALARALAASRTSVDRAAVSTAADALYRAWLDHGAKALQSAIGPLANDHRYDAASPVAPTVGAITLFVDGLRLDVAHRLQDRLVAAGFDVALTTALAPLPTVTQTAKPAVVPLTSGALKDGPELNAANAATGTRATAQVLRSLMADSGVEVVAATETGDPSKAGWTEAGDIDHRGHDMGIRLVDYLDEDVERVVGRIRELLDAGWQRVDVVTDHGWVLLPNGMEKVELPVATTEAKKGRCARLKDGADVSVPTVPWFWNGDVRIALAPGITCFEANKRYEHGGVSPQECVVPRLAVTAGAVAKATGGPEITSVKWLGLLCRLEFAGVGRGVIADVRALPADATTSIAEEAKETTGTGRLSLLVPDEEHEGERAYVVLVTAEGTVVAQREVTVGRNR